MKNLPGWNWEPKYFDVEKGRMHYIETGEGPTVLMLHGCPAWSYVWRAIIPELEKNFHVIAVDMLGMGRSDKPAIDYTFFDHLNFLKSFCEKKLDGEIVLIAHDWGSALGLSLARTGVIKPRGIAISELLTVLSPEAYGKPSGEVISWKTTTSNMVMSFCDPEIGPKLVGEFDVFNRVILPLLTDRKLTEDEIEAYCSPYPDAESRRALWRWPTQVPLWDPARHPLGIAGPQDVLQELIQNGKWLTTSEIPKLIFTMTHGMTTPAMGTWLAGNSPGVTIAELGSGRHYSPETHPEKMSEALIDFIGSLST